jgi:predicted RND superfamily exporter protein
VNQWAQIATVVMGVLAALSALVAITTSYRLLEYRGENMASKEQQLREELKAAVEKIAHLTVLISVQVEKQAVINEVAQQTLDALAKRLDRQDEIMRTQARCPLIQQEKQGD